MLVNNAGYATFGPFTETDLDEELKMMHVNMIALAHLTKLFLPSMLDSEDGKISTLRPPQHFNPVRLWLCTMQQKHLYFHLPKQ